MPRGAPPVFPEINFWDANQTLLYQLLGQLGVNFPGLNVLGGSMGYQGQQLQQPQQPSDFFGGLLDQLRGPYTPGGYPAGEDVEGPFSPGGMPPFGQRQRRTGMGRMAMRRAEMRAERGGMSRMAARRVERRARLGQRLHEQRGGSRSPNVGNERQMFRG